MSDLTVNSLETLLNCCRPVILDLHLFCGIAFRALEVERYMMDPDPNDDVEPFGCFPMFFFQKTASNLVPNCVDFFVGYCVVVSF